MNKESVKKFFMTLSMTVCALFVIALLCIGVLYLYQRFGAELFKPRTVVTATPQIKPVEPVAPMVVDTPNSGDVHENLQEAPQGASQEKVNDVHDTPSPAVTVEMLRTLNFDRIMQESRPGKVISKYVADYKKIMDDSIAKLNTSAQSAQKAGNWGLYASLQDDKRYLQSRKTRVEESAKEYIRAIVKASLSQTQIADNAVIVDEEVAYNTVPSQDVTPLVITRLENVVPQMPDLPKITIKGAAPAAPRQPVQKNKSPSGRNLGARRR